MAISIYTQSLSTGCTRRQNLYYNLSFYCFVLMLLGSLFYASAANGQKIYSTDAAYKADIKVFVVDAAYKADLLVFKQDREYKAKGNQGLWFFADAAWKADKVIFFVDRAYKADLKVFFADREYKPKWQKPELIHTMY